MRAALVGLLPLAGAAHAACPDPVGRLVSAEATVEVRAAGEAVWVRVEPPHALCEGDQVAVRSPGRAAIVLGGEVLVRLDRETTLNLAQVSTDSEFGLRQGVIHIISRFRKRFGVTTPFVNALVDGTEFTVAATAGGARIAVAEGVVHAHNEHGERRLEAGDAAEALPGAAPSAIVVAPVDAVRWAIHYPQVVWLDEAARSRLPADLRDAAARAQQAMAAARHADALAILDRHGAAAPPSLAALRAGTLLALGQVDAARAGLAALPPERDAVVDALDAVIAVARNETDAALAAARRAVHRAPDSAAGHLALSYALQARREVPAAAAAARDATRVQPQNPFAWARLAELQLARAEIAAGEASARRALELAPAVPRARALLGFATLLRGDTAAARAIFDTAIAAGTSDPLAHFGAGLAQIRTGELAPGRRAIEIAVLLDPTNAELRSYLGRVYVEEERAALGASQFDVARRLDPASPTPWYFDAFRRLRADDPLGAIAAGERAIERNDNRAVLRSSTLLDIDRAARSATLGEAYRDVGFDEPMRAAAMRALAGDPLAPAGHRLLAEAYADVPRFETARVSELLQAQLRQPIGQWPLPPQLLSPRLPIVDGPRALTPDETGALFARKPSHFAASALGGSDDTLGASLVASRAWDRAQLSLGHFDYRRDGLGERADIDLAGTRVDGRFAASPTTMIYGEASTIDREGGDAAERLLAGVGAAWDQRVDHDVKMDRGRVSLRHMPSVNQEIIVTAMTQDGHERVADRLLRTFPEFGLASEIEFDAAIRHSADEFGALYAAQGQRHRVTAGGSAYHESRTQRLGGWQRIFPIGSPAPPAAPVFGPPERSTVEHDSAFAYLGLRATPWLTALVGASHASLRAGNATSVERTNGKLGAELALAPGTTLRVAAFDGVKGPKFREQTLEPTHFAGFNQLFDDVDGTRWRRKAAGIDHRFAGGAAVGLELSRRELAVPALGCVPAESCRGDWSERLNKAYLAAPLGDRAAVSVSWQQERLNLDESPDALPNFPYRIRTDMLPIRLWLKLSSGISARIDAVRVRQQARIFDAFSEIRPTPERVRRSEHFWIADARLSYTRPDRRFALSLLVHNLFDRDFAFHDTDLNRDPKTPLFYPSRTLLVQANMQFH